MAGGRPSDYSEATADEICERLASGESMVSICRDDHMPSYATVCRWRNAHPEFRDSSARAREDGTHYLADDCLRISDDPLLEPADKRVRIDTRIRLIGKWNSRAYGDKIDHNVTGDMNLTVVTGVPERLRLEHEGESGDGNE